MKMASSVPFDENNYKYYCCFKKLHIRTAARLVSIALVFGMVINLFYSLGRTSTVIVYSWLLASFAVGLYGSLVYAVFKEKRIFTLPFLVFQAVFIILTGVIFFIFMLCAMFSTSALATLAEDFYGVNPHAEKHTYDAGIRSFVVIAMVLWVTFICVQCWFFEVIYRFYQFLEDRESSFCFNMEPDFNTPRTSTVNNTI